MRILIFLILAAPLGATTIFTDTSPGEMGPAMLMVNENNAAPQTNYTQSLSLHPGWNLVSWQVEPIDNYGQFINMNEILPPDPPPEGFTYADWFHEHGGNLYTYVDATYGHCYPLLIPESYQWIWDLNYAYYIWLDISHPWLVTNRPLINLSTTAFDIEPDPAWDDSLDAFYPDQATNGWFFMGYAAPGYCKLSTIYTQWPPPNGSQQYRTYRGPFHKLYWDANNGYQHFPTTQQYLVMVKSDDGKIYLPYDNHNPRYPQVHNGQEYDEIGVLEPGRGYFLGFRQATGTNAGMQDFSWSGYPGWPVQGLPPGPGPTPPQTASANHFQFEANTQWCYPVFIDTVDMAVTPMATGDEIGVFDGEMCVGAAVYNEEFPLKIACWKDDIATPNVLDGYLAGQEMTFVWYDASANAEVTFVPPPGTQAMADDPIAPTHSGFGAGLYGVRSLSDGISSVQQLPQAYRLGQNFPNPFNAETVIPLELPQRSQVKIELINIRGQNLGVIYQGTKDAGWEKIRFNATGLSSGIYFCKITAKGLERGGRFTDIAKMLVLK